MRLESDEEVIASRIREEKLGLGGEVLDVLCEVLVGDLESLRLYLGLPEGPVELHGAWVEVGDLQYYESWLLDGDGLFFVVESSDEEEFHVGTGYDRCLLRRGRRPMLEPSDFLGVPSASVRAIHRVVACSDFLDRLAWRASRTGKPGYWVDGYDAERETWRIKAAEPSEVHDLLRINRRRKGA